MSFSRGECCSGIPRYHQAATYTAVPGAAQSPFYTNVWGVEGLGVANSVAIRHGLTNLGQVSSVFPVASSPYNAAFFYIWGSHTKPIA